MSDRSDPNATGALRGAALVAALLGCLLTVADDAGAVPRYTAVYGQDCKLCHVNPTGGGMRSLYASQFLVPEELAATGWTADEMAVMSPELTPNIAFGLDLRSLLYQREGGEGSVFSMQGDVYLAATLGRGFLAYWEQGQGGSGEIFGAVQGLPLDSYLKVGRFQPDYGWKFADHQMFNRRYLGDAAGTDSPRSFYGSGLEVGLAPGILTVSGSVLGETEEFGEAYAGRALLQFPVGAVNLGLGGSVLRRDRPQGERRAVGGIWYLNAGPVTWLGELDETRQEGRLGNLLAQELTVTVARGVDLRGTHSWQDPDIATRNGQRQRYGGGVAWMPLPFFNLLAMGNYWDIETGALVSGSSYLEGELVLHFFY